MPIVAPGKRPGERLQKSKIFAKKGGFGRKKGGYASLNLTPMVDMFTIIVIYLLQNFSSDGDMLSMSASSTVGGDMGRLSKRMPRAPWRALATADITGTSGTSPTPRTPCGCFGLGISIMTVSSIGRSEVTGMR